jgi:hypothetical protein
VRSDLAPGWYILLYHNVSWEESPFLWHIGGTCPPDVFRDHVQTCSQLGELVSVQDGVERMERGQVSRRLFSFWFDDGFADVGKYAAPILAEWGITGATSICSRFAVGRELFWRLKLSFLNSAGAGEELRGRLRIYGCSPSSSLSAFTLTNFGSELLGVIDKLFDEVATPAVLERASRLFQDPDQLRSLHEQGWVIANHTASHYATGDGGADETPLAEFEECDKFIEATVGQPSPFWVAPFGTMSARVVESVRKNHVSKIIVLVGDRCNVPCRAVSDRILYRIDVPSNDRYGFVGRLAAASRRISL